MFNLDDKVAVITGASSGIGHDAAIAYAKAGANIAVLARRKEKLDELVNEIESLGKKALAVKCDVTDEENVKTAIDTVINEYGTIDILFNNAGIAKLGTTDTYNTEDWDTTINTNLKGIYLVSKYVVPYMKKQNYGKIVNTSSVNAFVADKSDITSRHAYNASKAGVIGLTRGMAATYGKFDITVNAICPGLFETEMTAHPIFKTQEFETAYKEKCPMNRFSNKGELNGTIIYLSSDASSYVTGQYIIVDGGLTLI